MQPQDPNQPNNYPQPQQPQYPPPPPVPPVTSQPTGLDPQTVKNPLAAMREGEEIICEITRHPIGIIGTYIGAVVLLVLLAIIAYLVVPGIIPDYPRQKLYGYLTLTLGIIGVIELLFVWVANVVYRGNRWIVTTDSVTQVTQLSLFNKHNSQLSMGNLEDVTVEKSGILPQMFNYGVLKAETAGERSKFRFAYCPNPNFYAQKILEAREAFEQEGGYAADRRGGFQPPVSQPVQPYSSQPPQQ